MQEIVPARPPVAEALKLFGPEPPDEPEKLLSSEWLDEALEIADIMDGKLPHWQRQERTGEEDEAVRTSKLTRLTASKLQISENQDKMMMVSDQGIPGKTRPWP